MNSLIERFYKAEKDAKKDISTHAAKLQKLFMELNDELSKRKQNTLSEAMLTRRILSTLENIIISRIRGTVFQRQTRH